MNGEFENINQTQNSFSPPQINKMGIGPGSLEKNDPITGLNLVAWFFEQTQKNPDFFPLLKSTIIFFNVMNFKAINQRFSYQGGNEYLCEFRDELLRLFKGEKVLRAGADHLVVISLNLTVDEIGDRIKILNEIMGNSPKGLRNQIKAGIYIVDGSTHKPVIMMDRASLACREVHGIYNKAYEVYDSELAKRHEQKQYVLEHFEEAFEKEYFKVYYQPVVRALTGKICGYEALARWIAPDRGMISPLIFFDVLEKVHLIHKLDAYIIEHACKDLRDDIDSGFAYQPISVNLSRLDFELSDIKKIIDDAVTKYNIPKEYLVLEVTESAFAADLSSLGKIIRELREEGYQVWLDDFGSGFSSFNNLQSYDFDFLKIDMNFLRSFDKTPKTKVILASIVDLAKKLGIHTLVEGVETQEQYEFMKKIGCELIQGYYFSKPLPLEEFHNRRAELCSFDTNESPEERLYYDEIGRINFLDNTPLREKKMDIASDIPIAIVEREDRHYRTIYANEAFLREVHSFGAKDIQDVLRILWKQNTSEEVQKYYEHILYTEEHRVTIEYNMMLNNYKVNTIVRFLSRMGNKAVYAFMTRNLTLHENL
ncbi:EAL domain, c-di-GMP-specific phosphodiesterase class I (or its enzymatically inactive variant) [Fibrobacter sp. UWH4]|nr:EAL domain, c-di-GMP-specific phosphodiesterase class I (or its enzymatically inactive variant) [Fibrobacter sp. UWH4]